MDKDQSNSGKIRALIVDDEEGARDVMEHLLRRIPDIEVTGKASSADEALNLVISCKPDLIFLDVRMPEKDGFMLVDYLKKYLLNTQVIFVTAHAEFAINAMKVEAFDYLLKPVMMSELQETILRFKASRLKNSMAPEPRLAQEKTNHHGKLKFNTRTGYILVAPQEIMYCEADVNYTTIYFGHENREVITVNLGKVEELLLSYSFYRINRSVLINQLYLSRADRQKKECLLVKDNERITLEISSAHIRELEKYLDHLTTRPPDHPTT